MRQNFKIIYGIRYFQNTFSIKLANGTRKTPSTARVILGQVVIDVTCDSQTHTEVIHDTSQLRTIMGWTHTALAINLYDKSI